RGPITPECSHARTTTQGHPPTPAATPRRGITPGAGTSGPVPRADASGTPVPRGPTPPVRQCPAGRRLRYASAPQADASGTAVPPQADARGGTVTYRDSVVRTRSATYRLAHWPNLPAVAMLVNPWWVGSGLLPKQDNDPITVLPATTISEIGRAHV